MANIVVMMEKPELDTLIGGLAMVIVNMIQYSNSGIIALANFENGYRDIKKKILMMHLPAY